MTQFVVITTWDTRHPKVKMRKAETLLGSARGNKGTRVLSSSLVRVKHPSRELPLA